MGLAAFAKMEQDHHVCKQDQGYFALPRHPIPENQIDNPIAAPFVSYPSQIPTCQTQPKAPSVMNIEGIIT